MPVCTFLLSPEFLQHIQTINLPGFLLGFSQLKKIRNRQKGKVHQSANYWALASVTTLQFLETDKMVFLANCSLCMFYSTLSFFCLNRSCNMHTCIYIFYFILFYFVLMINCTEGFFFLLTSTCDRFATM